MIMSKTIIYESKAYKNKAHPKRDRKRRMANEKAETAKHDIKEESKK